MSATLPKKTTGAFKTLMAIYERGPMTLDEINACTGVNRAVLHGAIAQFGLVNNNGRYSLPLDIRMAMQEKYPRSAVAESRSVSIWTPEMRGYEAGIRATWRTA